MTRRDADNHEIDAGNTDAATQQERHDRDDEQEQVPLPTIFADPADVRAAAELAEAERAEARHSMSPEQVTGLAAANEVRRAEDRVAKWRTATDN
jgi:hypothetical protein